ncbi:MAG: TIGR00268 family protein, partial [Gemmatimonadetes bacterium]|nr:TIGR00268 family protein [Gemmatimonadota bacterium]
MTATTSAVTLEEKLENLEEILRSLGRVLVGYSGGVDSAMLAVAAHRVLG